MAQVSGYATNSPDKTYKKIYIQAEDHFSNENYGAALQLYLQLDSLQKGNANINFKIGYCYLHFGGYKTRSIPYLEEAIKNTSEDYVEYNIREVRAPQSAYSYLAKAYQLSYRFDDAIAMYEKYKQILGMDPIYVAELSDIDHDIEMCKNGKEMVASPANYTLNNLGKGVNGPYADYSPVMSLDEKTLIFTSRRPESTGGKKEMNGQYFEDIYVSVFENEKWEKARSVGSNINTSNNEATVNLSADGQNLLIYRDDKGDGNLYLSEKQDLVWGLPKSLGVSINSPNWETHACFSSDNNILYYVSDKPGGYGGRDIYKCLRLPNGEWSPGQNLGETINTQYDEDGVFIHPNGKEIFFSSKGHNSMGGFDIFSSKIDDENGFWSKPVNMGSPINSPDDDIFFVVSADGKRAYFSSDKPGGFGEKDIYMIDFRENMPEALTLLKGFVTLNGAAPSGALSNVEIIATEVTSGQVVQNVKPIPTTGKYIMLLSSGLKGKTYNIACTAEGYQPLNFLLTVPPDSSYQEIERSLKLQFINFESASIDSLKSNGVVKDENGVVVANVYSVPKVKKVNSDGTLAATPGNTTTAAAGDSKYELGQFLFDSDKSMYRREYKEEFEKLLKVMKEHPELIVEVSGHTDSIGKKEYNLQLSMKRAQTIIKALVRKGIPEDHLVVKGYGESMPAVPNTLPNGKPDHKGMKLNRRVELKVVQTKQ